MQRIGADWARDVGSALGYLDGQVAVKAFGARRVVALRREKMWEG